MSERRELGVWVLMLAAILAAPLVLGPLSQLAGGGVAWDHPALPPGPAVPGDLDGEPRLVLMQPADEAAAARDADFPPGLDADGLNAGASLFQLRCHLCGEAQEAEIGPDFEPESGCLLAVCGSCLRAFDLFGIDTAGRYHRPPWFLRRFRPSPIDSPLSAWTSVLTTCEYADDDTLFGRGEVWQLAAETFERRRGDCEDTAILLADWLTSCGWPARVVLGTADGEGHAWVVLEAEGRTYLLDTTGGPGAWSRVPPRAELMVEYHPQVMFDRDHVWFRTSDAWTGDYRGEEVWVPGPWRVLHTAPGGTRS